MAHALMVISCSYLHAASLTPVTGLHCHAHAWSETLQPHKCMSSAKATYLLVSPDSALSPVTGLPHWAHLKLAATAVHLYTAIATAITGLHCHVYALGAPASALCILTDRALAAGSVPIVELSPAVVPSPHHHLCVCSLSLTLHRPMQLVKCMHQLWPPLPTALVPSHWTWRHY